MKKTLLTLAAIVTLLFASCEKEELAVPQGALKAKAVDCNCGGGSWDLTVPPPALGK